MKRLLKIKHFAVTLFMSLLLLMMPARAEEGQAGTESNLSMGFGARAMGLGRAFTAMADDPTAVFWNPAGLEYVYQQSVSFFHSTLYEGANYDFLGYAYPTLSLGTFGLGIARVGIGGIQQRDIDNTDLGEFSWEEYHGFFSYAKRLPWNLTSGLSLRVIRRAWNGLLDEGNLVDMGVGLDLGMMYKPDYFSNILLRDWSLGLNLHNLFTPQIKEGIEVDQLPLAIRFGLMRRIYVGGEGNHLNVLIDLDHSANRDLRIHFGSEYRFMNMGMIRLGMDGSKPTFGAGLNYSIVQIDYAFGSSNYSDIFSAMHRFSLSLSFGLTRDELFDIAEARRKEEEARIVAEMREADRQRSVAEHLENAETYFNEERWLDAIVEYQQVISEDPFNNRARIMLDSTNALLQGEFDAQRRQAVQAALDKERAESDQEFIDEHFEKGRLYLDKNQFTEALIEFNLALERAPQDATIQGAIETTKRRLSEEITRLIRQIRQEFQNENYSEALRLASEARLLGGDDEQVQNEIETLAQRIKLQENIQKGLGLYEIGEYDRALQVFEEALQINPDNELAKQYYERTKIETVGKSEKMDPATERRFLQGVDRFVKGKYQEAIDIWEEILQEHPYNKKVLKAIKGARERLNKSK